MCALSTLKNRCHVGAVEYNIADQYISRTFPCKGCVHIGRVCGRTRHHNVRGITKRASHFSCFIRGFRSNENAQGLVMLGNAFDRFGHGGLGLAACCRKTQRSSLTDRGFPGGGILPRCTVQISHSSTQQSQHLMCGPRGIHKKRQIGVYPYLPL